MIVFVVFSSIAMYNMCQQRILLLFTMEVSIHDVPVRSDYYD